MNQRKDLSFARFAGYDRVELGLQTGRDWWSGGGWAGSSGGSQNKTGFIRFLQRRPFKQPLFDETFSHKIFY